MLDICVTVDVVVNLRTSTMSPLAGASVNVIVVPLTEYANDGICKTPLILTIVPADVDVPPRVKSTVDPSPLNCSSVMMVNAVVNDCHVVPSYTSKPLAVLL